MKSTPEPQDRDLTLGAPIRPAKQPEPDRVSPFERDDWLPEGIRKHIAPIDEQTED